MSDIVGATIAMSDGRLVDPFMVTAEDGLFDAGVIAHALSMQCRYGGHTRLFYSVAEHCVHVHDIVRARAEANGLATELLDELSLWALVHDAEEAFLQDMPSPIKMRPEMAAYREAGTRLMREICRWLKLPENEPKLVKEVDVELRGTERYWLFGASKQEWKTPVVIPDIVCGVFSHAQAKQAWLARFRQYRSV